MLLIAADAVAGRPDVALLGILSPAARERALPVATNAAVSTRVAGPPFQARPEVFEYLLDHPEFATHLTRMLRIARYRIWQTPEGLYLDEGWGVTGHFAVIHSAAGTRVMHARGQYEQSLIPSIRGQAVVMIEYAFQASRTPGLSVVTTTVTAFVTLDSRVLALAGKLVGPMAQAKADKEARGLVKVFAKATRAVTADPARVYEQLRARPGVPQRELREFGQLLNLR
jgi:hypothetical protein